MGSKFTKKMSKDQDDDDVEKMTIFWFGDLLSFVKGNRWDVVLEQLETSQYAKKINRRYPTIEDDTIDKIKKKYQDYGEYRHRHASEVIHEMRIFLGKDADAHTNIIYPITMVDCIGRNDFSLIAYNRQTYNRQIVLWPLPYHLDECRKGFHDPIPFASKRFSVVFRGSCSSPLYCKHIDVHPPIKKTSRFEIVYLNHQHPWADLGLTKTELFEKDPNYHLESERIKALDKGNLSREEQMRNKFVLCIEGADISTSFGWVLASHCVAIHPYPFLYEVWYFQDLKPYVHFIPIALDGSDLHEVMEWCRLHPQECEQIAETSRNYMHTMCDPVILSKVKHNIIQSWKLHPNE